jgi:hypothetical protein
MENIGAAHEELIELVGEDAAVRLLVEQMNKDKPK